MKKQYLLLALLAATFGIYGQSGVLDPSFGNNGIVTTVISGTYNLGHTAVVQPDGKIIVAGEAGESSTYKVAVARYNIILLDICAPTKLGAFRRSVTH